MEGRRGSPRLLTLFYNYPRTRFLPSFLATPVHTFRSVIIITIRSMAAVVVVVVVEVVLSSVPWTGLRILLGIPSTEQLKPRQRTPTVLFMAWPQKRSIS